MIRRVRAVFDIPASKLDPNYVQWDEDEEDWTAVCYHCKERKPSRAWGSKAKNHLMRRTPAARAEKTERSTIWFCLSCRGVSNDGTAPLEAENTQVPDGMLSLENERAAG